MKWGMRSAVRFRIFAALVMTIAMLPCAFAEHGRDFAASYDFKDVAPVGADHVRVTLSLRLQNHSGIDIADAEVSLQDRKPAPESLGVFPTHLRLASHEVATLTGTFTVPTRYFARWRTGQEPRVVVRFMSAQGRPMRRPVEMLFMPGAGR